MEILEAAEIIGRAVRAIEDRGEVGFSPVNFEMAKNNPKMWFRQSDFWLKRYKMDSKKISQAVRIYADGIKSGDSYTVDLIKGKLWLYYLASPEKA